MVRPIGDLISTCFYEGNSHLEAGDGIEGYEVGLRKTCHVGGHLGTGQRPAGIGPTGRRESLQPRRGAGPLRPLKILNSSID